MKTAHISSFDFQHTLENPPDPPGKSSSGLMALNFNSHNSHLSATGNNVQLEEEALRRDLKQWSLVISGVR